MKKFMMASFCLIAFSAFAGPVEDAVKEVEVERNAVCTRSSQSTFSKCFGQPATCFYNLKYKCLSNEGTFTLKVKVREDYLGTISVRGTVISK